MRCSCTDLCRPGGGSKMHNAMPLRPRTLGYFPAHRAFVPVSRVLVNVYQRTNTDPHVKPPPTPTCITGWARRVRHSLTATSGASGIVVAVVLACGFSGEVTFLFGWLS